jgi:hypothetical protein
MVPNSHRIERTEVAIDDRAKRAESSRDVYNRYSEPSSEDLQPYDLSPWSKRGFIEVEGLAVALGQRLGHWPKLVIDDPFVLLSGDAAHGDRIRDRKPTTQSDLYCTLDRGGYRIA